MSPETVNADEIRFRESASARARLCRLTLSEVNQLLRRIGLFSLLAGTAAAAGAWVASVPLRLIAPALVLILLPLLAALGLATKAALERLPQRWRVTSQGVEGFGFRTLGSVPWNKVTFWQMTALPDLPDHTKVLLRWSMLPKATIDLYLPPSVDTSMFCAIAQRGGAGAPHDDKALGPRISGGHGTLRKALRLGIAAMVATAVAAAAGLEIWYRSLLPAELPQPSRREIPRLLKRTLWAYDFRGDGDPRLSPVYPFFVGFLLRGPDARHSLATGVARFFGQPERGLDYVLHQAALATWISRSWSAEDALKTYASHLWMGRDHIGVEAGAMLLFGRAVGDLTIPETALLVATAQSPNALSPVCHPERAQAARQMVLERMLGVGLIDDLEFARAVASPLGVRGACEHPDGKPPRPGAG